MRNVIAKKPWVVRTALQLVGVVVLAACALGKDENLSSACDGGSSHASASQAQAFAATLAPVFQQNACNSCHDGGGSAPYDFASADPATGVAAALKLVNLKSPADSRFVSKVGQELHQCGNDSTRCSALATTIRTKIEEWAKAGGTDSPTCDLPGVKLISTAKLIAPTDLDPNVGKIYTFDLSGQGQSLGLGQVGFSIEARLYSAPTTSGNGVFILSGPMVATSEKKLKVHSIRILTDGKLNPDYANFARVNYIVDAMPFNISASSWDFPWVSSANQLLAWENVNGDELAFEVSVSVTDAQADWVTDDTACRQRTRFIAQVLPILNNRCTRCHASAANSTAVTATAAWSLMPTGDSCREAVRKSDLSFPAKSLVFLKAINGSNGHPTPLAGQSRDISAITNWIRAEADAR